MGDERTSSCLLSRIRGALILLISLLLCGCSDQQQSASATSDVSARGETKQSTTQPVASSSDEAAVARAREQRIVQLRQEMDDARAQQTQVLQQKAELEARLTAHQEQGMQLLNSLKNQSRTREAPDAGFDARAKSELEAVLAQDNSMTTELEAADQELAQVESRLDAIEKDLASLSKTQQTNNHSVP